MEQLSPGLVPLLIGALIGTVVATFTTWLVMRRRVDAARIEAATLTAQNARIPELERSSQSSTAETSDLKTKLAVSVSSEASTQKLNERLDTQLKDAQGKLETSLKDQGELRVQVSALTTKLSGEESKYADQIALIGDVTGKFTHEFETLASTILEDKSKRFTEQNEKNLGQLLAPLASQLQQFQAKVEEVYAQEGNGRTVLATQVGQLMGLNQQLSQDAHNLTQALKGSGKTQGNWGEAILVRELEKSGLRKGQDYELRETYTREDGKRAQPDVIINLPDDKHLVVDAKVSVKAYVDYAKADSDSERATAIGLHLDSVRRHIKELSEKNYQTLYDLKSLDFVIMFVPVEPAFMLAISEDADLCESAWKKNVLLVSPTTFLFVVRTVAYLWRQEQATRSVQDIAKKGADFYNKLVLFVQDLENVGNRLRQASESYDNARNRLVQGRGNLIRQAEMLRDMGVKPSKTLPPMLVESANAELPVVLPRLAAVASDEFDAEEVSDAEIESAPEEEIPF